MQPSGIINMILKGQLGLKSLEAKKDNTNVSPTTGIFVGDSQEVQDAANRRIRAQGNVAYSTLRFLPYTRWATDVLDITGMSPDINQPDFTDATQGASHVGRGIAKTNKSHYQDLRVGQRIKVGPRKRHPYMTVTQGFKDSGTKLWDKIGNGFKGLGLIGLGGDIIQGANNLKEWYDSERNYQHVMDSVRETRIPKIPYVKKEKKGGKTHKPFGHRSILDNGWQSTKQLKNKKNVYGK